MARCPLLSLSSTEAMVHPANAAFPAFIDPLLEYLSSNLPLPLYSFLVKLLSHSFAAIGALASLCGTLLSTAPGEWNAQTLLPPIITLLAAYLALSSLYRTTSWLLRLSFWFMKWGTLLGILFGGVGFFLGNGAGNAVGNQDGGGQGLVGILGNLFDSPPRTTKTRTSKSRTSRTRTKKPKAWDSFENHQQWQYQHDEDQQILNNDPLQETLGIITDTAGGMLGGRWWDAAKALIGSTVEPNLREEDMDSKAHGGRPKAKGKSKAGKARSR